jgi:hypothetical protein
MEFQLNGLFKNEKRKYNIYLNSKELTIYSELINIETLQLSKDDSQKYQSKLTRDEYDTFQTIDQFSNRTRVLKEIDAQKHYMDIKIRKYLLSTYTILYQRNTNKFLAYIDTTMYGEIIKEYNLTKKATWMVSKMYSECDTIGKNFELSLSLTIKNIELYKKKRKMFTVYIKPLSIFTYQNVYENNTR